MGNQIVALFPGDLAADRVTRRDTTVVLVAWWVGADPFRAHERLHERLQGPRLRACRNGGSASLRLHGQLHAPLLDHAIEELGLRAVSPRFPAMSTVDRRAHQRLLARLGPEHVLPLALGHVV